MQLLNRFNIFSRLSCLVLNQLVPATLEEIPIVRDEEDGDGDEEEEPVEDAAIVESCGIVKRRSPLLVFCLNSH